MRGAKRRFLITASVIIGIFAHLQITERNLKQLLSRTEWLSIMGTSNSDYSITYPSFHNPRIRRSTKRNGSSTKHLVLNAPTWKSTFDLELTPSPTLLAPTFAIFETFSNNSQIIPYNKDDVACHYRSEKAALSLCGTIRGIVHFDESHYYTIHPLPGRFARNSSVPHILVRNNFKHSKPSRQGCAHGHRKVSHSKTKDAPWRSKRELFPIDGPIFVETAVFVDRDLFDHMQSNYPVDTERELIRFVLAMINAVQLLYHDPSLGRPVNFLLKRLEILKEEAPGLSRPPDIDRYLSSFCNWQRTKNPAGDREPQHWDHALILTGLDLYVRSKHGKISSQVVGLAPVAGMCAPTSSCTVNEGRHFESVYVVAHEIGHNLGMRHDGPLADNDCDPSSYIMSPTLGSGKITWSSCSRRYLQQFLDTPQSRCLLDHGSSAGQLDHSAEGALPGERFDADQQCMLKYGQGSRHSSQQPLDDVCRDLHCERERYTWTSHPALEGTVCGPNLWCRGGKCVIKGLTTNAAYIMSAGASDASDVVNGGWSPWRPFSDCASGCLYGEEGRLRAGSTGIMVSTRSCNNPRPQGGGKECDGIDKKYQSCNAKQCLNVPRLTIREFAEQICSRAKDVDKDLTGSGFQRISSDSEEACTVWCQKRNGGQKSRGWTFPDGTACQIERSHRYTKPSYCINGHCKEFVCEPYDEVPFAQLPDLCPYDREDNEISWSTLLRRDSRDQWSSASGCHFNCISPGSGIRLVVNKLKRARSSIQLCYPDQYGCNRIKSAYQHASRVCNDYKERVSRLSGFGMQLTSAVEDPDRPCRVACQDENINHRFYLVNGEEGWFPFGTDCSKGAPDKKAFCISGKCLKFGPDDTPLSESEFTLPLLSRTKRSLHNNGTKVTAILDDTTLEDIIRSFNRTLTGDYPIPQIPHYDIDLNNPIHVNMDMDMTALDEPATYYYPVKIGRAYIYT
ncbi:hypothetical protein PPYR_00829 [Photinus pyralis]|uniref:Peptidase M12B domain-containing protein n=2 Tax=Photinus pyralis TaxID=7054 RepID=A0A5N4B2M7_PHOPY|nr:A disintegrin and metalloproteinase with thrombospondin motifs adt-1-like isoform X1 [Photinus pyralis]KAB0803859.1 hypothetical protein PPYR_00829 [Photinus pyralis]